MSYVDGFLLPIPKKNREAYRRMARKAGKVWREHGALDYVECMADDVKPGKWTSFPQAVKLKPGDVLSLGSFTPPLTPRPGLAVTVRYEGLPGNPAVSVRFR